jgi:hypothetical protein
MQRCFLAIMQNSFRQLWEIIRSQSWRPAPFWMKNMSPLSRLAALYSQLPQPLVRQPWEAYSRVGFRCARDTESWSHRRIASIFALSAKYFPDSNRSGFDLRKNYPLLYISLRYDLFL